MKKSILFLFAGLLLTGGCQTTVFQSDTGIRSIPCCYRFKMLTRPEDQSRVETAIRSVALGGVVNKTGTVTFPEYRFRVERMEDLDKLHPRLIYNNPDMILKNQRRQALNVKSAGVEISFDSTDLSASASTTITFFVKPGSRLYYKDLHGYEQDITARVDNHGKVNLQIPLKEGQKYVYARAVKDHVSRYIRINIFTNRVEDISKGSYK